MSKTAASIETRDIGSLRVSVIGLGCNNFGWHIDQKATQQVVDAAFAAGITLFDTADIYGSTQSEVFLGKALGKRRDQVVIATKFGMEIDKERAGGARPEYVKQALEDSLKRLGTDYIDLYYLHQPDSGTPIEDTIAALEQARTDGQIREYACSNFDAKALAEARTAASTNHQSAGFVAVQNEYSLLHRQPESGVLEACEALGMAFIPYFPLKSGLLTGKYRDGVPEGTRLDAKSGSRFAGMSGKLLTDHNLKLVAQLSEFAKGHGHTILELAFSWLLSKPAVASVIAGATSAAQVESNARAAAWKLTADEVAEVDAMAAAPIVP